METINLYEAKARLSQRVERAVAGEEIIPIGTSVRRGVAIVASIGVCGGSGEVQATICTYS